jgi:A/G-specific adenine glycosylase
MPAAGPGALGALLAWYRANRRALPWRRTRSAYRIWVSEVMLQQTTAKAVLPYYNAFLSRFPSLKAVASAELDDVLAVWAGLGYYRRARNLWRTARHIREHHRGRFPSELDVALKLPGVGRYTASAVLSIAFGRAVAVVDGNVRRVLARRFTLDKASVSSAAALQDLATALLDRTAPGDWNQALMELGATVCVPRNPRCPECPLQRSCRARRQGRQEDFPPPRVRRPPERRVLAACVVRRRGQVLLARRDPDGGLLEGLWEVPQTSLRVRAPLDLRRDILRRYGLEIELGGVIGSTRHSITFRRIEVQVHAARLVFPREATGPGLRWATRKQMRTLPLSALSQKILSATPAVRGPQADVHSQP